VQRDEDITPYLRQLGRDGCPQPSAHPQSQFTVRRDRDITPYLWQLGRDGCPQPSAHPQSQFTVRRDEDIAPYLWHWVGMAVLSRPRIRKADSPCGAMRTSRPTLYSI